MKSVKTVLLSIFLTQNLINAETINIPEQSTNQNISIYKNNYQFTLSSALKAAYINVYTQPAGSAAQEMHTELVVNDDIYIPNNGDMTTEIHILHVNGDKSSIVYSNSQDEETWGKFLK